jgi:hypothetical protein
MRLRLTSLLAAVSMVLIVFAPVVAAEGDYVMVPSGTEINLQPDPAFTGSVINVGNASTATDVEATALGAPMQQPGRYFGPYLRSSLFRFSYEAGGNFSFQSTIIFSREQIMNGVSEYVIRWPIDPSDFSVMCFGMWGLPDQMPFPTGPVDARFAQLFGGFTIPGISPFAQVRIRQVCAGPGVAGNTNLFPLSGIGGLGNPIVGSFDFFDQTGYYYTDFVGLVPDIPYHFVFVGLLKEGHTPAVWLTIEKYQVEVNTTFEWSNGLTGAVHIERLPVYPAIAFDFLQGAGDGGLTSYRIPFDGDSSNVLEFAGHYGGSFGGGSSPVQSCDDHLSVYLPFAQQDTVTFRVWVAFEPAGFPTSPNIMDDFNVTVSGRNFLLTSTPSSIGQLIGNHTLSNCDGGVFGQSYYIWLTADKPLTLLGYTPAAWDTTVSVTGSNMDTMWDFVFYNQSMNIAGVPRCVQMAGGGVGYDQPDCFPYLPPVSGKLDGVFPPTACGLWVGYAIELNGLSCPMMQLPLFVVVGFTDGVWSTITPGPYYATYDFGWGTAYLFPGEVDLVMFLTNGTAIGFDQIAGYVPGADCGVNVTGVPALYNKPTGWGAWAQPFICDMMLKAAAGGGLFGILKSPFEVFWDLLVKLGNWVKNFILSLLQAIGEALAAFLQIVRVVVFSLLVAMPFAVALFVGARSTGGMSESAAAAGAAVRSLRSVSRRGWELGKRSPNLHLFRRRNRNG